MCVMDVLSVAANHMSWLSARQAVTATNLANADTPGFKAQSIEGFSKELNQAARRLTVTQQGHLSAGGSRATHYATAPQDNSEINLSGNDVVIEKEMRNLGDNARLFSFDVGLMKSFHRMYLASVKG
jgi:flagellar basal-body rod protein FlgB